MSKSLDNNVSHVGYTPGTHIVTHGDQLLATMTTSGTEATDVYFTPPSVHGESQDPAVVTPSTTASIDNLVQNTVATPVTAVVHRSTSDNNPPGHCQDSTDVAFRTVPRQSRTQARTVYTTTVATSTMNFNPGDTPLLVDRYGGESMEFTNLRKTHHAYRTRHHNLHLQEQVLQSLQSVPQLDRL